MIQRLALYSVLGLWLGSIGVETFDSNWWCGIGLFIASEWLIRRECEEAIEDRIRDLLNNAKVKAQLKQEEHK